MYKILQLVLLSLILLFTGEGKAVAANTNFGVNNNPNRSCLDVNTIDAYMDDIIVGTAPGLLPVIVNIIKQNFSMLDPLAEGVSANGLYFDGSKASTNVSTGGYNTRCAVSTNDVRFCYTDITGTKTCASLQAGNNSVTISGVKFTLQTYNDMNCIYAMIGPNYGYPMGCKLASGVTNSSDILQAAGCYTGAACNQGGTSYSKSYLSLTGTIMQCYKQSLYKLFIDPRSCGSSDTARPSGFSAFQSAMRNAVMAALILYVAIFGVKIALSQELTQKGEVFMFIMKMILVIYFSVGFSTPTTQDTQVKTGVGSTNGQSFLLPSGITLQDDGQIDQVQAVYSDGIANLLLPFFAGAGEALSEMMFAAAGSRNLCKFDPGSYPAGYTYLALWDALDCHLGYYLGIIDDQNLMPVMLIMLLPSMPIFFIVGIFLLIFVVLLLGVVVYFVNITMVALMAIAVLVYLAPLFVPMVLFKHTKPFFEGWIRLLLAFAVQPVAVAAFLAFFLTIFDQIIYGTCTFTESTVNGVTFQIMNAPSSDPKCNLTFGYLMAAPYSTLLSGGGIDTIVISWFLFPVLQTGLFDITVIIWPVIQISLFMFVFYQFSKMLNELAADLSGGPSVGKMAISPTAVISMAGKATLAAADAYSGGKLSKARQAVDKAKSQVPGKEAIKGALKGDGKGDDKGNKQKYPDAKDAASKPKTPPPSGGSE